MTINYPTELETTAENLEKVHSLLIRMAAIIFDLREQLADLAVRASIATAELPPKCRHETPIGDYCAYCAETPEG